MKTITKMKLIQAIRQFDRWLAGITLASILISIATGIYWYVNNKHLLPANNTKGVIAYMPLPLHVLIYGTTFLTIFAIIAAIVIHAFILKSAFFKLPTAHQQWMNWYWSSSNYDSDSSETR